MAETKRVLGNTLKTSPRSGVAALSSPVNIKRAEEEFAPMKRAVDEQVAAEALLQQGVNFSKGEEAKALSALEQGKLQAEEKATKEFATTQRGLVEEAKRKEEKDPFPTFQPTQEDAMSYGQLGSMIATLGVMLGSGGKASAKVALGSMSGMMSGWQKGRKDLWDKEAKTFDKEMSRIKAIRDSITKDLEMGIKLASTDREASRAAYASAAHKAGANSIIAAQINRGQSEAALDSLKSAFKLNQEIDKERRAAAAKQTEREDAERRHNQLRADAAQAKREKENVKFFGSVPEYVQKFTGSKLKDKDANEIMIAANAVGDAFAIKQIIADNPEWVGRTGQIKNFFNRTIESINLGEPAPEDKGQPELIFAKRYAEYLVNYERALAQGARGFTVYFQNRFNKLLEQNQFNAAGISNLMDEQVRTITAGAASKAPNLNRQNLIRMAYDVKSRAGDDEATRGMQQLIGGEQPPDKKPVETVKVGEQTYSRPPHFTDNQWSEYKQKVRAKE
jgi:hypothetical protein